MLGGALYLTHLRNTGAAFSFAEGFTVLFTLVAVAVAVVIVRTARRLFPPVGPSRSAWSSVGPSAT